MSKLIKDRETLYMILSLVLISVFSLTIVYAALSVTLNITGNSEVVASSWDIHLENVKVTSGSVSGIAPSITSPTTASFSTTLNMPGDFYEFTIDGVNDGSIDAMIDGVSKTPTLTETQAKYLNYIVEYQNGESINTKQLVSKNAFVRLKVRVEFRKDITASDLPTSSETLNLAFTVNYVQSDGGGSDVRNNGVQLVKVMSGDGTQVGDEVCIKEECFYVISSDAESVTLLSKYNLCVGNIYSKEGIIPIENPTGRQDSTMLGWVSSGIPYNGVTIYSDADVGYSGSIVESYVNNYNAYLITQGVTPIEARLITYKELTSLGCSGYSCLSAPRWVYSTSYFVGVVAADNDSVVIVYSHGEFSTALKVNGQRFGVRPVIVVSKSNF